MNMTKILNILQKHGAWLVIVLYAVVGFVIYSDVLVNGIFIFDDFEYVVGNPLIQSLSFFQDMTDPRHIGYLSFAVNYALDGENPYGYHLVNIIIHIINAVVVFFLTRLLLNILSSPVQASGAGREEGQHVIPLFAGLIFLVHPVETQAVSYITQRFTSLSTMFYLLSVMSYLAARVRLEKGVGGFRAYAPYILSIASAVLAMKTKEITFTIPFILGIIELLFFGNSIFSKRRFSFLIPFAATLIIIPFSLYGPEWGLIDPGTGVDEVTRRDKLYDLHERSAFEYFITQFGVIVTYIRLLILPVNQMVVYNLKGSKSVMEWEVIISVLILLSIVYGAYYLWRKAGEEAQGKAVSYRLASFGIIWFFVTLSIESSVIPIKDLIFEHRAYLPSVGFFMAIAALIMTAAGRFRLAGNALLKAGIIILCMVVPLSIGTYVRNRIYTDEVMFWDDIVRKTGKAIGYNNRGNAYTKTGQLDLALQDLDKTISFFPRAEDIMAWENADFTPSNMSKTYMSRGQIYVMLGDVERAKADFDMAKRVMMFGP